jgi:peptidoglycan hydrolase-like protein with peptidoglycan-binding domain
MAADEPADQAESQPPDGLDPATLKRAMKAFRKRLKLTRLNEESKLGRSPLTGGKHSDVVAIMPPHQYPPEVWQELVKRGRLKDAGSGFYELVEQ